MAIYTVSNLAGVTADYTTIQAAINVSVNTDVINILGGIYSENLSITGKNIELNFCFGAKLIGAGSGTGITATTVTNLVFRGLNISNYATALNVSFLSAFESSLFLLDSVIDGDITPAGGIYTLEAANTIIKNCTVGTNSTAYRMCLGIQNNTSFINCNNILLGADRGGSDTKYFANCLFKDTQFALFGGAPVLSGVNGYDLYRGLYGINIVDNCTFKYMTNSSVTLATFTATTDVAVSSIADINNKIATDATAQGGTVITVEDDLFTFQSVALDSFDFPTDETSYILNQHIGAYRYAEATNLPSSGTFAGWQLVVGAYVYIDTTSDTPAPLVLTASIPQARKARRIAIQYERVNNIEQFGANGAIEVSIKLSFDGGVTFGSPVATVVSGIDSTTLDFDYLDRPATDFELTIESQGIAGGAGGVRFRGFRVEFYDMDEQITAGARTLYAQKATNSDGYFVVGLPYKVETTLGDFTAQEIKDNPAANIAFADGEETNIEGFALGGEIYETFVAEPVEITNVRAVKAGINGSDIEIKNVPCSNFNHKMLKFKNGAGAWEYLLFYARDEEKPSRSSEQYLQFEDGYKNVNGDIQRDFKLYNDEFEVVNKPALDYLDKNQNVWYANGWQFSSFTTILMPSTAENFPLLTNERLLKADLTQVQFNEMYARFKTGDRVTFVTSDYLIDMYGFVSQMSESDGVYTVYFKFTGATGNDDLVSLDALLGDTDVYIVAYDAWELCTVDNLTVTTTSRSVLNVSLTLKTNPETNYRV